MESAERFSEERVLESDRVGWEVGKMREERAGCSDWGWM